MLLEAGDEIPADGDLLEAINLEVNESSLTGEQMTAKSILSDLQQTDAAARTYSTYPENRVYRSTMVMNGRGVMRVTEVGDNTEIGHTASKSMEETVPIVRAQGDVEIVGLMVSLNRQEVGLSGDKSKTALDEVADTYGFKTGAIVDMAEVTEHLYNKEYKGNVYIDDTLKAAIDQYYETYGA